MKKNYLDKKFNFLIPIQINDIIRIGSQNDGGYIISESSFKKCDNLYFFDKGKIFANGDYKNLKKKNKFLEFISKNEKTR